MEKELLVKGHPNWFCSNVARLTTEWSDAFKPPHLFASYSERSALKAGVALVQIEIGEWVVQDRRQLGRLDVYVLPSSKLRCALMVRNENWSKLASWWDWLRIELERLGFVDAAPASDEQARPQADSGAVAEQPTLTEDEGSKKHGPMHAKLDALLAGRANRGEIMTQPTVFISYSREDAEFTRRLADDLRTAGYSVWMDISGLRGGQEWAREIDKAVRACDAFLLIISPDSMASEWVSKETLLALGLKKRVVPIMWRKAQRPVHLVDIQYVDFRGTYDHALGELYKALLPIPVAKPEPTRAESAVPISNEILSILKRFQKAASLHVEPDIPPNKLRQVSESCEVPETEHILGLINLRTISSFSDCLLFGHKGIYYCNPWNLSDLGHRKRAVPYSEFPKRVFKQRVAVRGVSLDNNQHITLANQLVSPGRVLDVLNAIRDLIISGYPVS